MIIDPFQEPGPTEECMLEQSVKILLMPLKWIEQKGVTFDHNFDYSLPLFFSFLKKDERIKGERIAKIVVKSHAFLLNIQIVK